MSARRRETPEERFLRLAIRRAKRKAWWTTPGGQASRAKDKSRQKAQTAKAAEVRRLAYAAWAASPEGQAELAHQAEARVARRKAIEAARYARPEVRAKYLAYAKTPQGRANLRAARHRRRSEGGGPLSARDITLVYKASVCFYCGVGLDPEAPRGYTCRTTLDHKTPLKRGGTNAMSNLVACCWSCNCRKSEKTAEEFLALIAKTGLIATLRDRSPGPRKPRTPRAS